MLEFSSFLFLNDIFFTKIRCYLFEDIIMSLKELVEKRRAFRALEKTEITLEIIKDLALTAQMSASCFNYQPWNFIFVYEERALKELFEALNEGNNWAKESSMIVAVFSKKEIDCVIGKSREYFLFDTGMATAFMILRATEMDLIMHPIAGYNHSKAKEILKIPEDMILITLLIVGKKTNNLENLTEKQKVSELKRPPRKSLDEFIYYNKYSKS